MMAAKARVDDGRVRLCHRMQPVQTFADDVVGQWLWRTEARVVSISAASPLVNRGMHRIPR